jgi:hypothetical protein
MPAVKSCMRNSVKLRLILVATALSGVVRSVHAEDPKPLNIGGGQIEIHFQEGPPFDLPREAFIHWIHRAAEAVTAYYGRYPVPHVDIEITPEEGHGIHDGTAYGHDGGLITVSVGRNTAQSELEDDWVMTHEMVHLAFPRLDETHKWLEEGLATYVEPLGRIQTGSLTPERVWRDLMLGLPQGLPQAGDQGLDITHTWGRTYWGGALFCLEADIEIRKRTQGQKGLVDALRAILQAGGNIREYWEIEPTLRIGDEAIGVPVLVEQYRKWRANPVTIDLDALWKQLGVKREGPRIIFNDTASLALERRAITAGS